jgi:GT2 family glycosyltransferase
MMMYPKVGIIYLTYPTPNWERDINRCLASMEKITYPKDRLELICVESKGKIAPLQAWFQEKWMPKSEKELPRISYIFRDEAIGFAGNNNLGLIKAKELGCEYVHLTNEDTDVDPDYILRAVERAESDPSIAYVQSLILLGEDRSRVNTVGNAFHYLGFGYSNGYGWTKEQALAFFEKEKARGNKDLEIGYGSGAGVLCRVSALDHAGLFDEGFFMYHEDTDASLRARMRGLKTVVEPTSILWHYYEFAKNKINYYWMERNRYVLLLSYYRLWTLIVLFPVIVAMDLGILVFSIKGGWFDMKRKMYRELFTVEFWKWVMVRRKDVQAMRNISDREFLRQAVPVIGFQEETVKNPLLDYVGNPLLTAYWWVARWFIV